MSLPETCFAIAGTLVTAWLVPILIVAGLAEDMERGGAVSPNYRGRAVFLGLGVAWPFACLATVPFALAADAAYRGGAGGWSTALVIATLLVCGVFGFGAMDDALGSPEYRGFRGHLRAVRDGRLTTGAIKALGVGALAITASLAWSLSAGETGRAVAGAAVVALTANLLNLLDLRPARTLKAYIPLAVLPLLAGVALFGLTASVAALWLVLVLGPVVAVWRYDAGERGMLGDAGANAAGALAGFLAVVALPMPWIALWAVVLLWVNLASERVSFSSVIERSAALSWLDRLGRPREDRLAAPSSQTSSETGTD